MADRKTQALKTAEIWLNTLIDELNIDPSTTEISVNVRDKTTNQITEKIVTLNLAQAMTEINIAANL